MKMGQVAVTLKIMPDSPDADIERIKKEIEGLELEPAKLQEIKIEDMAFGLKAIKVLYIMPDTGGTDRIENAIKEIDGVAEVEPGELTLL